jgi:hypothetical protein
MRVSTDSPATTCPVGRNLIERLSRIAPILGVATICFLVGILVAIRQSPPYYTVRDAWIAYCALSEQQGLLSAQWPAHLWWPDQSEARALVQASPVESYGDYTLYSSGDGCRVTLVDQQGNEVHRWEAPFRHVFPAARHAPAWLPDQFVLLRSTHLYPNGDLLALYETTANTPSGCGLAKLDVNGRVLWTYDAHAHHDVAVADDGRIFVLTHRLRRVGVEDPQLNALTTVPLVEDCIAVLSADGQQVQELSLLDALIGSPYFRPLLTHVDRYGDITHNNTVNIVPKQFAAKHQGVSAGDLMICLRNLNLVAIVNLHSAKIVWATTGPWNHPHEPQPLESGNILLFDNLLANGAGAASGIVEFDPANRQIAWTYCGADRLHSDTRGAVESLPNDNVLITDTDRGRIVEVNRAGEIVWEYFHPQRGGANEELIPVVCGARRYTREHLPFMADLQSNMDSVVAN